MTGTIKKLMPEEKGFGFIRKQDGTDTFFHCRSLIGCEFGQLREGLSVEFDEEPGKEGKLRAKNVKVVA